MVAMFLSARVRALPDRHQQRILEKFSGQRRKQRRVQKLPENAEEQIFGFSKGAKRG